MGNLKDDHLVGIALQAPKQSLAIRRTKWQEIAGACKTNRVVIIGNFDFPNYRLGMSSVSRVDRV